MRIICWWSGGITSAVACKKSIDIFGLESCEFIMMDTGNEDIDTYRFKLDCEKWYGKEIKTIRNENFDRIEDVWEQSLSLNVAHGAICSSTLKRDVRLKWEKDNEYLYDHQVFGFDIGEPKRALALRINYPKAKAIFPLLIYALRKKDCIKIVEEAGIEPPRTYKYGFQNNNCFKTGCIQGGIGYWQKMQRDFPDKFDNMAAIEHRLTAIKGQPVTILKDQGKNGTLVFLKHNPSWPFHKDISMMKGREPEPLIECNGMCGTNDLGK